LIGIRKKSLYPTHT